MAVLKGTSGANKLLGGGLADSISGLGGNDSLFGNGGNDTLLGGDGIDILDGGTGNDTLKGEKGNDTLKGGAGADKMYGGAGNDKYYVDNTGDRVFEQTNKDRADIIYTTVAVNTASAAFGAGQIERVTIQGTKAVSVTGNSSSNILTGNAAANMLSGAAGADMLSGGGGNDILNGGTGADKLNGGAGNDLLIALDGTLATAIGGTGTDTLKFTGSNLNLDFGIVSSAGARILDTHGIVTDSVIAKQIEIVDIRGSGANQLNLDQATLATLTGGVKLTVLANADDTVTLGFNVDPSKIAVKGTTDVLLDGPILALTRLDGKIGFRLGGEAAYDYAGYSVSDAGDINGDGLADFMIGAPHADKGGTNSGAAYLVFGDDSNSAAAISLASLNGTIGYRFAGISAGDHAGNAVSGAGDINGDGIADLLIGAHHADAGSTNTGRVYLIFGGTGNLAALDAKDTADGIIDLALLDGTNGYRFDGTVSAEHTGQSVSAIGDVNGDGIGDFIIGSSYYNVEGAAYVIFGGQANLSTLDLKNSVSQDGIIDLADIDVGNGFRLNGTQGGGAGFSVSSAGDVNGDGYADIIVGARFADVAFSGSTEGAAYVVFGSAAGFASQIDLSALNGKDGFRIAGNAVGDATGVSVSSAGDINGDGYDDVIVGADKAVLFAGKTYVVFGKADWSSTPSLAVASLNGSNGFTVFEPVPPENFTGIFSGFSVSAAGDINGDGLDDLIIGAQGLHFQGEYSGGAGVLFGSTGTFSAVVSPASLDGANGFRIDGVSSFDRAGYSVSGAGDLDGDGFDEIIVGAFGTTNGTTYIVYGNDFRLEADFFATSLNENPTGTSAAEIFIGDALDNTITGGGGKDTVNGGDGNDTIIVADSTFFRIDGGGGTDSLKFAAAGAIDFGNIDGNSLTSDRGRIAGIEIIDVDNGQQNDLSLHLADVFDINCQGVNALNDTSLDNTLVLEGNTGDTLALALSEGWTKGATIPNHVIWFTGDVQIAVDDQIKVNTS